MGLSKQEKNGWGGSKWCTAFGGSLTDEWAMGMMMIDAANSSDGSNTTEQDNTNILYTVIVQSLSPYY